MIPTRLSLSNFMCYRADGSANGTPTLDLDGLHVICLTGENGAGKSTLLDAITWALWGQARMPDDDLIAQGAAEMSVELEFLLADQLYRVRRARQRGGTGKRGGQTAGKSQLDLQVKHGDGWRPLAEIGVRETQARIEDLLRMSYQTFINASFLLQGRADEFTARTPAERKQVLADILDLGEYAALEAKAKERAKALDDQLRGLRGRLEQLAEDAARAPFWREQVAAVEQKLSSLAATVAATEAAYQAADEQRRSLEQQAEQRKELLHRVDDLRHEQERREAELSDLRMRIAQNKALIARHAEIHSGLKRLEAARAEVERLGTVRRQYDELARRQNELRQLFVEAKNELREQLHGAETQVAGLAKRAARGEQLRAELAMLEARSKTFNAVADEQPVRLAERQALSVRLEQLDALLRRRGDLDARIKLRLDSLVSVRENRREAIARLEQQLGDEPRWQAELAEAHADQERLVEAEARLATLRSQEQAAVDQVTELRAACTAAHTEGEKLKQHRSLIDADAGRCPVCRSDLGTAGIARVHAHYDEELTALRARYAAAKRDADQGEARLKTTRGAVADLDRALPALRSSAARRPSLTAQLALAAQWRAEAARLRTDYDDLCRQIDTGEIEPAAQAELVTVIAELHELGDPVELAEARRLLDERLVELEQRLKEQAQIEGRRQAYDEELLQIDAELSGLPALEARIAELRRVIETNDFAHAVRDEGQQVKTAIEALAYSPEAHQHAETIAQELRRWEEEERGLALAEQQLQGDSANLEKTVALQTRDAEAIERLVNEGAALEAALRALPATTARVRQLQTALAEARRELHAMQKDLGEKQAYLKRADQAAQELEAQRAGERQLIERHGLFAELAEAFGKKGLQAMLIETAIPQIEDEANRILGRMTDGQMHLSFEMQRDTKKGDTVETLEIKIADGLGTRVYTAFSGGEAMRANFAVRIALSRLLARRAGARLETLVVDEGFAPLDAIGRERMVEAITSVQDDFRRIIVITHLDELKDRFPVQIEVTKTPQGSRWELR